MQLIDDYTLNNEDEFEQWMKNTPWIERMTMKLKWYSVESMEPFRNEQFVYLETVNYKK